MNPTKSIQSRTDPCIWLGPTGNIQVSHWFLNLRNGISIKRRKSTPFHDPPHIINWVHDLADENNKKPALDFFYRHGNLIEDTYLADLAITERDVEISGVDEIGITSVGVYQLENKHHNYEISGLKYNNNGEIAGVYEKWQR